LALRMDNPAKLRTLEVSEFYARTQGIFFFDSMVAFRKQRRKFPRNEVR
jgi:hypothetical protein